ncbi:hypothetical protein KR018_004909 [Drosophila ironensis]|nr:hypothetical protein KR018_004909 [Drosophila ironensis]
MSDSNHNQHRLHSHGVGDHHHDVEYYEYLLPGIYDYPVTHSAASTITAYNLPPILALSMPAWSIPDENPATYVAGPYGLVNYVSDMQSHLALPTDHTIVSGMIYQAMEPNPLTPYPHQMLVEIAEENNQMDNYGYQGYGDPRMNLCFNHIDSVSEEDGDRASELDTARGPPRMLPMEQEAMMPEEVGEPADAVPEVEMPCEVRRSSKR